MTNPRPPTNTSTPLSLCAPDLEEVVAAGAGVVGVVVAEVIVAEALDAAVSLVVEADGVDGSVLCVPVGVPVGTVVTRPSAAVITPDRRFPLVPSSS
jgi:hypothetical protein